MNLSKLGYALFKLRGVLWHVTEVDPAYVLEGTASIDVARGAKELRGAPARKQKSCVERRRPARKKAQVGLQILQEQLGDIPSTPSPCMPKKS